MADERSPLLEDGREHSGRTDYLAAENEPEPADSTVIGDTNGSTNAEQQAIVVSQNSLMALVRLATFAYFF